MNQSPKGDLGWSILERLLLNKPRGLPRGGDDPVLNGIYRRLRTELISDALRVEMAEREVWANIGAMPKRTQKPIFSHHVCRMRIAVERFFNKISYDRALTPRHEKHLEYYLAIIKLASARIWLKFVSW